MNDPFLEQFFLFSHYKEPFLHLTCHSQTTTEAILILDTISSTIRIEYIQNKPYKYDSNSWTHLFQTWFQEQQSNIPDIVACIESIQRKYNQPRPRIIHQCINYSLTYPTLYTKSYWQTFPDMLSITADFQELKPRQHADMSEIPLLT